jgi:hypothetical protein
MSETRIGKLWIRTDQDGTQRLGGVILEAVPAGTHIRLRKNRAARSRQDGEYLLFAVQESDQPVSVREAKREELERGSIHSFDVSDSEWEQHEAEMGR